MTSSTIPSSPKETAAPGKTPKDMPGNEKKDPGARSRTIARVAAVQALFQCEQSGQNAETVLREFTHHRRIAPNSHFDEGDIPQADLKLLEEVVHVATREQEENDRLLSSLLPEAWPLERLDPVLRALLRAAIAELRSGRPPQVVINEYMDVAHGFFSGEEPKMVNGILDAARRKLAAS
ncbi:transcription antitermination factor NusB [Oecophyllibacter saccharovorans]